MAGNVNMHEIKTWLKQQHIPVPLDWLEACLEWLKEEYKDQNLTVQKLKNCVYEQWLVADLQEIGVSSLPLELASKQKICLNGTFALQVNGLRDIGKPSYGQLNQLKGKDIGNSEVSAAPKPSVPPWETKPTRMLMLNLTDGTQHIQGMEYRPINVLSTNLSPGAKILIKGPVDCRFGLLLLTSENIQLLGGEVESLLEKYSQQQLLADVLQYRSPDSVEEVETTEGYNDRIGTSAENTDEQNYRECNTMVNSALHTIEQGINISSSRNQISSGDEFINPSTNFQYRNNDYNNSEDLSFTEQKFDNFESDDDDFVKSLDHKILDEIERENSLKTSPDDMDPGMNEDEDMLQDMMEFQKNANLMNNGILSSYCKSGAFEVFPTGYKTDDPFSYLCKTVNKTHQSSEYSVTVKGFISTVVSRLECTVDNGWQLAAKVNDGTFSVEADIHDKVLHQFIGISAEEMMVLQGQARDSQEIKNKIFMAIRNCKQQLQDLNCLMVIKFSPALSRPCVMSCIPMNKFHIQQLLQRVQQ